MRDQDEMLTIPGLEFGSGVIGVCDICGHRQAVIVLQKERYKLCVIDFLNKTWISSKTVPGAPLPPFRSDRVWFPTDASPSGKAPAIVLSPTKQVKRPVVLITPDIYGITTCLAETAIRFAKEGFEVLIPDVTKTVGIGVGHHLSLRLGARAGRGVKVQSPKVIQLVRLYTDALKYLKTRDMVDVEKSAVFGASYGGSLAIALAGEDPKLSAIVLAYPMPVDPPEFVRVLSAPVLFLSGGSDGTATKSRRAFSAAADQKLLDVQFADFPQARRDFLSRDVRAYRVADAEAAWKQVVLFLRQRLLPPPPKPPTPPKSMTSPSAPPTNTNPAVVAPPLSAPASPAPLVPPPTPVRPAISTS